MPPAALPGSVLQRLSVHIIVCVSVHDCVYLCISVHDRSTHGGKKGYKNTIVMSFKFFFFPPCVSPNKLSVAPDVARHPESALGGAGVEVPWRGHAVCEHDGGGGGKVGA